MGRADDWEPTRATLPSPVEGRHLGTGPKGYKDKDRHGEATGKRKLRELEIEATSMEVDPVEEAVDQQSNKRRKAEGAVYIPVRQ